MTPFSSVAQATSSMKPFAPLGGDAPQGPCSPLRVLDANVYDALELAAEAFGGIGAGRAFDYTSGDRDDDSSLAPNCMLGLADFATDDSDFLGNAIVRAMRRLGTGAGESDAAVRAINERRGRRRNARVPFELWRQELCIVRGPHPDPDPAIFPPNKPRRRRRGQGREERTSPNHSI